MNKIVNNLLLEEEKFMSEMHLNIFRMELLGVDHKWMGGEGVEGGGWAKRHYFSKICQSCPTMMKLATVIPYLKKIQAIYKSHDTLLVFC